MSAIRTMIRDAKGQSMKTLILFLILCALMVVSCRDNGIVGPPQNPDIRPLTTLEKSVVASDNAFGFNLLGTLNQTEMGKNVFLSPFSVSMALGMALDGASGTTLDSMKQTLGLNNLTTEQVNDSYKSISGLLQNLDPNVTMNIANSVWVRNGFPVLPSFLSDCSTYFDAEAATLDFASPDAVQTINGWVNSKTNGRIQTVLNQIPPDVVMYLINAVYFKGAWTYQFDPSKTADTTFTTPAGTIPCKMMYQHATYAYRATGQEQIIDLPYGSGLFSMTIILPGQSVPIDEYCASLTQQKWDALTGGLDSAAVDLYVPKFTIEYGATLNDALKAMGMDIAFSDSADFSRISSIPLCISEVNHKTFVDVNEEGTEAAAVTVVSMRPTAVIQIPSMRIDRPFICAIREHATGTILFVGKIVSPNAP
jgi:serine protease inhibitor